ncbi:hypothetical protein FW778_06430 [Ginsengibacter hankyongi]|uniref:Uncharacterized protein n=1 Tax=Ginsengibacter hankyongi TaxID=2607284 RepID=A0A5J5INX8_9BACT|nr:hypothetical protein [Ginsengibacter hankyongi]KAA9041654.1 hypothetical protein FW778_06430 [Ginsengibacter hankyongi]
MDKENRISTPDKIIVLTNSIREVPSNDLRNQLISFINDLINEDFNALVQLLYRVDVNEKKLKELLKENENADAPVIIADLIITRQLQKIESKKQFSQRKKSDAEDSW